MAVRHVSAACLLCLYNTRIPAASAGDLQVFLLLKPPPEVDELGFSKVTLVEEECVIRLGFDSPPGSPQRPSSPRLLELPQEEAGSEEDEWQFPTTSDKEVAVLMEGLDEPGSPRSSRDASDELLPWPGSGAGAANQQLALPTSSSTAAEHAATHQQHGSPGAAAGDPGTSASAPDGSSAGARKLPRQLSRKLAAASAGSRGQRPQDVSHESMLMLLVEALGKMKGIDVGLGQLSEEQLQGWLRQLLDLTATGENDTVKALYSSLKQEHSWVSLGSVFNALVYLRESWPAGRGGGR
jgi:hypothetical protein